MRTFQRNETVICSRNIKDSDGNYADPATSFKITVTDPVGTAVVSAQDMVKDATGKYHYDYKPGSSAEDGIYDVEYVAVDGTRTTIYRDQFRVVE